MGNRYNLDGKITEELFCGRCGNPGWMVKVPKHLADLEETIREIEGV